MTSYRRITARGIVCKDNSLLVMERWRRDSSGRMLHYYSIPGGRVERGESPEQTVVRELMEEMAIAVRPVRLIAKQSHEDDYCHYYFWCELLSGEPILQKDSEEAKLQDVENRYEPGWVPFERVTPEVVHNEYAPFVESLPYVIKNDGFMP